MQPKEHETDGICSMHGINIFMRIIDKKCQRERPSERGKYVNQDNIKEYCEVVK
jgi:uncharacterized protein (UPF0218 family)